MGGNDSDIRTVRARRELTGAARRLMRPCPYSENSGTRDRAVRCCLNLGGKDHCIGAMVAPPIAEAADGMYAFGVSA